MNVDRGNIFVETTNRDRVYIVMERTVKDADRQEEEQILKAHRYNFKKQRDDVFIESRIGRGSRWGGWGGRPKISIKLTVRVPSEYNVTFDNGAGNVEIEDVEGMIRGETGAGNIMIEDIEGMVTLSSGAGNIKVSGGVANATITTGAGNVKIHGLKGTIEASTGAGNIEAEIMEQPRQGSLVFTTGAGNLVVALAEGVGVEVNAEASLGSARCEFPLEISRNLLSRSFSGSVNGGGVNLEMHSGVGNVVLKRL